MYVASSRHALIVVVCYMMSRSAAIAIFFRRFIWVVFLIPTVAPGVFKKHHLSGDERSDLYDVNFDHAIYSSTFSVLLFPGVTVARAVSCQAPFCGFFVNTVCGGMFERQLR